MNMFDTCMFYKSKNNNIFGCQTVETIYFFPLSSTHGINHGSLSLYLLSFPPDLSSSLSRELPVTDFNYGKKMVPSQNPCIGDDSA